ncbi:MAG TPA: zinc-ribbon domain-containing protein [Ktedonobacteraceae bacterium]|nr:zinc-ribbon domain-containing protein [Ktedonobacteraceae bacterium]
MQSITGQYECSHRSGIGLDFFTSRLDRLTLLANGRFTMIVQEHSRLTHAAQSVISGQQISTQVPETKREGTYTYQGNSITLNFDDGTQEQGQLVANGIQLGQNMFEKISDSTLLPPTNRLKMDMEDIAKGLKIASAIGGAAIKAAKTIQDTLQSNQSPPSTSSPAAQSPQQQPGQRYQAPAASPQPGPAQPARSAPAYSQPPVQGTIENQDDETLFCDQCGAPVRPGKRFCNHCGARLP